MRSHFLNSARRRFAREFDRVPMKRMVLTEEVAGAFAFLASNDASGITGTELRVDCGLTSNLYVLETMPSEDEVAAKA